MNKREKKLSENRANFNFRGIAVDKSKEVIQSGLCVFFISKRAHFNFMVSVNNLWERLNCLQK